MYSDVVSYIVWIKTDSGPEVVSLHSFWRIQLDLEDMF